MPLSLRDKEDIVTTVNKVAKSSLSAVVADYRGITVDKMTDLRKLCREAGVYLCVVRNTLMRRIIKGTAYECLKKSFIGPTLIAFSEKHPGLAARLLKEFAKINPTFEIKAAAFEGKYITANQIDILATIPTYEEGIVRLISIMKEVSAGKLVRILVALKNSKKNA